MHHNLQTKLFKAILLAILLFVFFFHIGESLAQEPNATMVRPDDGNHKVIKEACSVCHKEKEYDFIIMIYSTKKKLLKGSKASKEDFAASQQPIMGFAAAMKGKENFHKQMNCFFCHIKDEENKPIKDRFLSLDGRLSSLCTICHNTTKDLHFISEKRLEIKKISSLLKEYGLKLGEDGTVNCITCHTIHSDKAFGQSVRDEFKKFIKNAIYYTPHGRSITCIACHTVKPKPKKKVTFVDNNIERICRKCHVDDIAGHHVTGVESSMTTYLMDFLNLPLFGEEIYCSTCHDEVCYKTINPRNKKFLINGPYKSKEEFCNKCHKKKTSKEDNPHKQIGKRGEVMKEKCAMCHMKFLKEGSTLDISLVSPIYDLCSECHIVFDHPDKNHLVEMGLQKLENLKIYEKEFKVKFPLIDDIFISCVTCHNPHDKGVLRGQGAVGAGEYMFLRGVSFEEACSPCHGKIY